MIRGRLRDEKSDPISRCARNDRHKKFSQKQKLRVRLDTKRRAGKAVTLIEGFAGSQKDLEELGKKLKTYCGTGGSVKDNQIIIQGDQREKVIQWLKKNGYSQAKKI